MTERMLFDLEASTGKLAYTVPSGDPDAVMETPTYILITVSVFSVAIFLLGVFGNALVLYIILGNKEMKSSVNFCLLSLSLADIMVLIICMPSALAEFYGKEVWYLGQTMCKLVPFLEHTAAHASALTITAISLERYYAICQPLQVRIVLTYRGTAKLVASLWVIAAAFTFPFIIITIHRDAVFHDGTPVHVCITHIREYWQRAYVIGLICIFFVMPFIVIVILYVFTGWKLLQQNAESRGSRQNTTLSISLRLRRQIVLMLSIVAVMFFICLLPFKVVSVWHMYATSEELERFGLESYLNLISFARTMYYINSAVNPIVYNLVSTRFRNYFKKTLCCSFVQKLNDAGRKFLPANGSGKNQINSSGVTTCGSALTLQQDEALEHSLTTLHPLMDIDGCNDLNSYKGI